MSGPLDESRKAPKGFNFCSGERGSASPCEASLEPCGFPSDILVQIASEIGVNKILIPRETFRLAETRIGLPLFEVDEGTASDLPRGVVGPWNGGVSERRVVYHKSCFARSTEWQT